MPGRDGGADEHGAEEPHSSRAGRDKFRGALRVRVEGVSLAGRRSVVGQGFVARQGKRKEQIPPDKTQDWRHLPGARRPANSP
jgi:hypothetical protein